MPALDESFDEFLKRRESVSLDYINGSPETLIAISTSYDPATFFPPSGDRISGAAQVNAANAKGASSFKERSTGHFDVLQSSESGDLAFWTGMQHAKVHMQGQDELVQMSLRMTEVFRREDGEWKLVHRHADMPKSDT
jgi:ketosteroid isomerase-like protein